VGAALSWSAKSWAGSAAKGRVSKKLICAWLAAIPLAVILVCRPAIGQDALRKVLTAMDASSQKFQSAQADFEWTEFEAAVQQTDLQNGVIYFKREGAEMQMAAHLMTPQEKLVVYRNGVLSLYEPKIDHLTEFSAGANRQRYESFSTLGFGGRGSDLPKAWTVTYLGSETVDGAETAKLNLVATDPGVRNVYDHIILWIDTSLDVSRKQQFFESSGDYRIAHYTNIKVNGKIPPDVFKIKTTAKTTVVKK
jgi:outer membrane lipoprotein-sorting protein